MDEGIFIGDDIRDTMEHNGDAEEARLYALAKLAKIK